MNPFIAVPLLIPFLISPLAQANDSSMKSAITWTTLNYLRDGKGEHAYALVGSDKATNAYHGDTLVNQALPILCIQKANLPKPKLIPPPTQTPGGAWRGTWSGGYIGLTRPVLGSQLTSLAVANKFCAERFGSYYRIAEFHDGDRSLWAGWDFWGEVVSPQTFSRTTRFWIYINDQVANPWL